MTSDISIAPVWRLDLAAQPGGERLWGAQQQLFLPIASDELCGARELSVGRVNMPPGGQAVPHWHAEDRTVVVLSGLAATLVAAPGRTGWQTVLISGPGDVLFLPAGWVHQAVNLGMNSVHAVEISADPVFNNSVRRHPEITDPALVARLRDEHRQGRLRPGVRSL